MCSIHRSTFLEFYRHLINLNWISIFFKRRDLFWTFPGRLSADITQKKSYDTSKYDKKLNIVKYPLVIAINHLLSRNKSLWNWWALLQTLIWSQPIKSDYGSLWRSGVWVPETPSCEGAKADLPLHRFYENIDHKDANRITFFNSWQIEWQIKPSRSRPSRSSVVTGVLGRKGWFSMCVCVYVTYTRNKWQIISVSAQRNLQYNTETIWG